MAPRAAENVQSGTLGREEQVTENDEKPPEWGLRHALIVFRVPMILV
jgi:hypothetical protein